MRRLRSATALCCLAAMIAVGGCGGGDAGAGGGGGDGQGSTSEPSSVSVEEFCTQIDPLMAAFQVAGDAIMAGTDAASMKATFTEAMATMRSIAATAPLEVVDDLQVFVTEYSKLEEILEAIGWDAEAMGADQQFEDAVYSLDFTSLVTATKNLDTFTVAQCGVSVMGT